MNRWYFTLFILMLFVSSILFAFERPDNAKEIPIDLVKKYSPKLQNQSKYRVVPTTNKVVLFQDDFESGLGNWSFTPGDWATVTYTSNSPTTSVTESPGSDYSANDFKPLVISQRFDFSAGNYTSVSLSFYHADSTESGWDYGYCQVSTDSSTWTELGAYDGYSGWIQEIIDLSAYAAEDSVWIRFLFDSDGSVQYEGWYIDDVVVDGSAIDNVPPTITVLDGPSNHFPSAANDTVLVEATDNIGVDSVNISWEHGSLSDNLALNDDGDGTWSGSITLDDSLNNLNYIIQVNDTSNNYVRSSQQSKSVTDNDDPQLSSLSATPNPQDSGGFVNISVDVTDNIAIGDVYLHITYPDSSTQNLSITENNTGNTYFCNKTFSSIGTYSYFIWCDDSSDNSIISSTNTFLIGDQTLPVIANVVTTTSDPLDTNSSFGWINITCEATDNVAIDDVSLNITLPDSSNNNIIMTQGSDNTFYYNTSTDFATVGNYSYHIWTNDTSNNQITSSTDTLSIPPNWDINMDGECTVFDFVLCSNRYNESGASGWIREDVDNNGQVKILDLVFVSEHYGETWWT